MHQSTANKKPHGNTPRLSGGEMPTGILFVYPYYIDRAQGKIAYISVVTALKCHFFEKCFWSHV
jgi:hypothetical protein